MLVKVASGEILSTGWVNRFRNQAKYDQAYSSRANSQLKSDKPHLIS
jgi:hypothetical protein